MDDPMGETQTPILTKTILRNWQNSLLKVLLLIVSVEASHPRS
jgi:hypothetical protein